MLSRSRDVVVVLLYSSKRFLINLLYLSQGLRQLLHCLWVEYAIISFSLVNCSYWLLNGHLLINDKIILLVFNILLLDVLEIWLYLKFAVLFFLIFSCDYSCGFLFSLVRRWTIFVRTCLHFIWISHSITLKFKSTWWQSFRHSDRLTVFIFMSHWLDSKGHLLRLLFNN